MQFDKPFAPVEFRGNGQEMDAFLDTFGIARDLSGTRRGQMMGTLVNITATLSTVERCLRD
jgi:hypothetical protein